jgi:hypothetical protein
MTRTLFLLRCRRPSCGRNPNPGNPAPAEQPLTNADLARTAPVFTADPAAGAAVGRFVDSGAKRIREKVLRGLSGWPEEWVKAPPVEERRDRGQGLPHSQAALRDRARFWGAALLYEPEKPAVNAQEGSASST